MVNQLVRIYGDSASPSFTKSEDGVKKETVFYGGVSGQVREENDRSSRDSLTREGDIIQGDDYHTEHQGEIGMTMRTQTVCGRKWLDCYTVSLIDEDIIKEKPSTAAFRSEKKVIIPAVIGSNF
ncbi:Hypothetical predicted protein [Paramuricea clavata]|uniref:Uncharacterized protein n=1 Tax=Paramuricea clavata TaxID=317549 RepID=A0A6S7JH23_PARCT|nr:Hypothetical predicted protein [Paramuricea clavata]